MDENLEYVDLSKHDENRKAPMRKTKASKGPKKCGFASAQAGNLQRHMKTHNGEKSNKCNQCDFASSNPSTLRDHLKTHSGEKAKKCSQCNCASSWAFKETFENGKIVLIQVVPNQREENVVALSLLVG